MKKIAWACPKQSNHDGKQLVETDSYQVVYY